MEALAAELPVVAVEATGTSDVLEHGQQGLLTDNDSDALAQAISQVLDDEALRQQFKEAAAARAKEFDMLHQAEKLVDVYQQAIEDQQADRLVQVDKQKKIFQMIIDEEQWQRWLGLESS
jgi:glycosyltransferase involved in cell wall biosynthesis